MTPPDLPLLLLLALAHLMGDFTLQRPAWVADRYQKRGKSRGLYLHALTQGMLAFAVLALYRGLSPDASPAFSALPWPAVAGLALLLGVTHFIIDLVKSHFSRTHVAWFVIDQAAHLLVIAGIWLAATDQWPLAGRALDGLLSEKFLLIAVAYFIVLSPFALLISFVCQTWAAEITTFESLTNAGKRIGQIERFLILTFILVGQFAAIGFLLAAKSVLRFGDSREDQHRKINEYILVGTMTSFAMTIAFGLMVVALIARL